jgi:hypothetical protein
MTEEQQNVIDVVRRYLEPHQPPDYRLNVSETGLRHSSDDWWEVVVQPDKDVYSYDYYGRLAEAEGDIESHEKLKVLLLPVLPGD